MSTGHRVVIKHLTGTKASKVEAFSIAANQTLVFGRDPSCDVRFDKDREDLVSRRHVKLMLNDADPLDFALIDLGSLNGTFLNSERITGLVKLQRGDVIQLGNGGPQFVFDFEPIAPEPQPVAEKTQADAIPPQPVLARGTAEMAPPLASPSATGSPIPVRRFRKARLVATAIIVLLLVAAAVISLGPWPLNLRNYSEILVAWAQQGARRATVEAAEAASILKFWVLGAREIARENLRSVVRVDGSWRLIDRVSQRPIRQVYVPNKGSDGSAQLVPNVGSDLPVFVLVNNNRLEPLLTMVASPNLRPIGGQHWEGGLVVSSDGLILTGRAAIEPWKDLYQWPKEDKAGVVVVFDEQFKLRRTAIISRRQFPAWLPIQAQVIVSDSFDLSAVQLRNRRAEIEGRVDSLTILFADEPNGLPATVVRKSDQVDLATLRVDRSVQTRHAQLRPSDSSIGDSVVLLGFEEPGKSDKTLVWSGKITGLKQESTTPALTRYELVPDTPPTGILGWPLFDNRGRVAGVQSEADPKQPSSLLALPIRYGLALIDASEK